MEKRKAKRVRVRASPVSQRQLQKWRAQISDELPDLIRRNQLADDAMREKTLSGRLRRVIHESSLSPMKIAEKVGITWAELDDFLTGERTLLSDTIDRLVKVLKLKLPTIKPKPARGDAKAS